jgi:hypothetical protein
LSVAAAGGAVRADPVPNEPGKTVTALVPCVIKDHFETPAPRVGKAGLRVGGRFAVGALSWRVERVETRDRKTDRTLSIVDPAHRDVLVESMLAQPPEQSQRTSWPGPRQESTDPWVVLYLAFENTGSTFVEAPRLVSAGAPSERGIDLRVNDAPQSEVVASSSELEAWLRNGNFARGLHADARAIAPGETRRWVVALQVPRASADDRMKVLHVRGASATAPLDVRLISAGEEGSIALRGSALPKILRALRAGNVASLQVLSSHDGKPLLDATVLAQQSELYVRMEKLLGSRGLVIDHAQSELDATHARLHLHVASTCPYGQANYDGCSGGGSILESFGAGADLELGLSGARWWLQRVEVHLPQRFVEERTSTLGLMKVYGPNVGIRSLGCHLVVVTTKAGDFGDTVDLLLREPAHKVLCQYGYHSSIVYDAPNGAPSTHSGVPCKGVANIECPRDPERDANHTGATYQYWMVREPDLVIEMSRCLEREPSDLPASGELRFGPPASPTGTGEKYGGNTLSRVHHAFVSVGECISELLDTLRFQNAVLDYEIPAGTDKPAMLRVRLSPRADEPEPLPARLMLESDPWASVEVDGRPYGATPLWREGLLLPAGKHALVLRTASGASRNFALELGPGELLIQRWRWSQAR